MKILFYTPLIGLLLLLAGCITTDVDQEYGKGQMSNWDMQIVDPAPAVAEQTPEGLAGIDAEKVMDTRNKSFGEATTDTGGLTIGTIEAK
ncbi:MAG: hypothetical protein OEV91_01620 [Desulfobulbaceae bacterium]|nr:hypothetical protein [Desulfobulbaceae bacterium]